METTGGCSSGWSLDFEMLESGCCGPAGAFGYDNGHYDVSVKCGERVLLPAVTDADADTLIAAELQLPRADPAA